MQIAQRTRPKGPHTFYDQDYKRMEKQGFKHKGWNEYSDSPYAEYKRRVRQYEREHINESSEDMGIR